MKCKICDIEVNNQTGNKVTINEKEQILCLVCENDLYHALPYDTKIKVEPLPEN